MSPPLIFLWAPPRSLSTVFLRIMVARGDFAVMHEPMCDLAAGKAHIASSGASLKTIAQLQDHIQGLRHAQPVFIKETCEFDHADAIAGSPLVREALHAFMLREPARTIASHHSVNPHLRCDDVGFKHMARLFDLVSTQAERPPIFVCADRLQASPSEEVRAFCARAGLVHLPESLSWSRGHLAIWERTRHWHESAADSTQVQNREGHYNVRVDNNPRLASYYEANLPHYLALKRASEAQRETSASIFDSPLP